MSLQHIAICTTKSCTPNMIVRLLIVFTLALGITHAVADAFEKQRVTDANDLNSVSELSKMGHAAEDENIHGLSDESAIRGTVERKMQSFNDAHFFEIRIFMESLSGPGDQCQSNERAKIDRDINDLLVEYGIGDLRNKTNPTILSAPCPLPETTAPTSTPIASPTSAPTLLSAPIPAPTTPPKPSISLMPSASYAPTIPPVPGFVDVSDTSGGQVTPFRVFGYLWGGAGGCNFCGFDRSDARRRIQVGVTTTTTEKLSTLLIEELKNTIAPNHTICLGSNPSVKVKVIEVTPADVDLTCGRQSNDAADFAELIPDIASNFNASQGSNLMASCGPCTRLDFEKRLDGSDLVKGDLWRKNEYWKSPIGVKVFVSLGKNTTCREKGRIFDTSNPGTSDLSGYPQLGSPNADCESGAGLGPGIGNGGKPGQAGENCEPVGSKYKD